MDYDQAFLKSFKRVTTLDPEGTLFFKRFYERFSESAEIREKMAGVDLKRQYGALRRSLLLMLEFFVNKRAGEQLRQIAFRHNHKGLDIRPHMYDLWLVALIDTVKKMDPQQDRDVLLAWKLVLSVGITFLKDAYDRCE